MDFFRNYIERILLLLVAVALLVFSTLIILKVAKFNDTFAGVHGKDEGSKEIDQVDTAFLVNAKQHIETPAIWNTQGLVFSSRPYLEVDGKLVDPGQQGYDIHPPVPNKWLIEHGLDILDPDILSKDSDNDGFSVLEEWKANTDPQDKDSHPPFITKLRLAEYHSTPFRLLFAAYNGDSFQINTIDLNQPTQFLKIGDRVKGTHFQIEKFEPKSKTNPRTGAAEDISELTLINTETGETITLILEKTANSPDDFAKFHFLLDGSEIDVKRLQEFSLPSEKDVSYKLLSVTSDEAVIENTKTSEKLTISKLESKENTKKDSE